MYMYYKNVAVHSHIKNLCISFEHISFMDISFGHFRLEQVWLFVE